MEMYHCQLVSYVDICHLSNSGHNVFLVATQILHHSMV